MIVIQTDRAPTDCSLCGSSARCVPRYPMPTCRYSRSQARVLLSGPNGLAHVEVWLTANVPSLLY